MGSCFLGRKTARKFGILPATVCNWHHKWTLDEKWAPDDNVNAWTHHRIFTDEEEAAITDYITAENIRQGGLFDDEDFQTLALNEYIIPTLANDDKPTRDFLTSSGFMRGLKQRNGFSAGRSHDKHRLAQDAIAIDRCTNEMTEVFDSVPSDHISNPDETSWRLYSNGIVIWAPTGTNAAQIAINCDEKDYFTALAAVSAAGQKFPICLIAKRKRTRCDHGQLGDCSPHVARPSKSG
jgi:hypothetical protein